jgi:hypothetical protein
LLRSLVAAGLLALATLLPSAALARDWQLEAALTGRYVFVPDSMLDSLFALHGSIRGVGPGLELAWTRDGFHAIAVAELVPVMTPDQVWLERDARNDEAKWVEVDMRVLSTGLIFAYEWRLFGPVSIMPAMGFVPVTLKGELREFPTEGERGTPPEERTKAPGFDGQRLRIPTKFRSSDLGLRLRVQPAERFFFSVDAGWRMVVYTGLSAGAAF